jgi:hypothetical protein
MRADRRDSASAIDKNGTIFDGWCRHGVNAAGADPQSHSAEALIKADPSRLRRSG